MVVTSANGIIIDEEFRDLLPPLDAETYLALEANLLEHGCRDALVVWKGHNILVDGHNRYEITTKHNIPTNTIEKEFSSREAVLIWIIETQVSRRNLTSMQLSHYRGLHYKADKKIVTNVEGINQYSGVDTEVDGQNDHQPQIQSTAGRLSKQYRVSQKTIRRDAKVAEAIDTIGESSPEAKRMILAGDAAINKKELQELPALPKTKIKQIAALIERGIYENGMIAAASAAISNSATATTSTPGSSSNSQGSSQSHSAAETVSKLTDAFSSEWKQYSANDNYVKMKPSLKRHIDKLEAALAKFD